MSVRPEEKLCAEALQHHLQQRYGITSVWSGVDNDPPDLRFMITHPSGSTESWAVEVTGLVQRYHQDGREDGGNRYDFARGILKMVDRLNAELGSGMKCSYFLNVTGPLDPKAYRNLEGRVREYVLSGRTDEEALDWSEAVASVRKNIKAKPDAPDVQRVIDRVARDLIGVTIKGVQGGSRIVLFSGISGAARVPNSDELAANVDATLDYAVAHVLKEKIPRMETVQGYDRKVLLVWKAIPTVSAEDVGAVFASKLTWGADGIFLYEYGDERTTLVLNAGLLLHLQ